jgi:hypothetical protein
MDAMQTKEYEAASLSYADFTFLTLPEVWQDAALLQEWERLVAHSDNLNVMYQSPKWLAYLQETGQIKSATIAVVRTEAGKIRGIVPLIQHRNFLPFNVSNHILYNLPLRQVDILGGELLLPPDHDIHNRFFLAINDVFPEAQCIDLSPLSGTRFTWHYLQESEVIRNLFLTYVIDGMRDYHTVPLPPTFELYLAQFSRKKRYNLNRQVRLLRDSCAEEIELVRVESRSQIELWLETRRAIDQSYRSRWNRPSDAQDEALLSRRMGDLADRGLLRNYVLKSAHEYFGCISGCQYGGIYHLWNILHNNRFGKFSPGTCTFFLAIEDLFNYRPVTKVNLGFGDPHQLFNTQVVEQHTTVVLFRKTLRNRLYRASHAGFRSCVEWVKLLNRT